MSLQAAFAEMPGSVRKDARNDFAGYAYASADCLYETIRPALAKRGLAIYMSEYGDIELLDNGKGKWIRATFEIAVTPDGKRPDYEPERITAACPLNGAQAFAALRTFALKYFLRGKLMLSLGEGDEIR